MHKIYHIVGNHDNGTKFSRFFVIFFETKSLNFSDFIATEKYFKRGMSIKKKGKQSNIQPALNNSFIWVQNMF